MPHDARTSSVPEAPAPSPARRAVVLAVVLTIGAAVRVTNVATMSRLPITSYQRTWTEGDMAGHWDWSSRILAGDVVGRNPPHVYTGWMQRVAPLEVWERWWGGERVFHKAPLYAYFLAASRLLVGDDPEKLALCQAAAGLLAVALSFALAERLFDLPTGALAGLGVALYGPFLFYEALLLRDALAVTTSLLMLWSLARCEARAAPGRWWTAGILFATALLAREATILFAPFVVLLVALQYRREPADGARALGRFAGGAALGLAPLVARNLLVGVKPWSISAIAVENIIYGHIADSAPVGFEVTPAAIRVLREAQGRLLPTIRLTLASYHGDWMLLVQHELLRWRAIFSPFEMWDDANWYYFRDRDALLRFALQPELVLPMGLVGLAIDRAEPRRRLLRYFLASSLLAFVTGGVVARYRLPAMAVLLIYVAAATTWIARRLRDGRRGAALVAILAIAAVTIACAHLLGTAPLRGRYRSLEYRMAAEFYVARGEPDRAVAELRDGLAHAYRGPEQTSLPPRYLDLVDRLIALSRSNGSVADARRTVEELAADYPRDVGLRERRDELRDDHLGHTSGSG